MQIEKELDVATAVGVAKQEFERQRVAAAWKATAGAADDGDEDPNGK